RNSYASNARIKESVSIRSKAASLDRCPAIKAPVSPCLGQREREGCIGHRLLLPGSRRNRKSVKQARICWLQAVIINPRNRTSSPLALQCTEFAVQQTGLAVDDKIRPPHPVLVDAGEVESKNIQQTDDVDEVQDYAEMEAQVTAMGPIT